MIIIIINNPYRDDFSDMVRLMEEAEYRVASLPEEVKPVYHDRNIIPLIFNPRMGEIVRCRSPS